MGEARSKCYLAHMMPPELVYICRNSKCVWFEEKRIVALQVVGPGLYARPGPIVCECNFEVFLYLRHDNAPAPAEDRVNVAG